MYNFSDLAVTKQVDTCSNLHGACALSPGEGACVMACPGLNRGQVRVELFDRGVTKFIPAHEGEIRNLQVRSIHWSPYDRVGVVNADP